MQRNRVKLRVTVVNVISGDLLRLTIHELDLEDPVDILTIHIHENGNNKSATVTKIRTLSGSIAQFTTETTGFFGLEFTSDATISGKGFRVEIEIINNKCGGYVRTNGDYITSPNYPSQYQPNSMCEWLVEAPSNNYEVQVKIVALDFPSNQNCEDKVIITSGKMSRLLCGSNTPKKLIRVKGGTAKIQFLSGDKVTLGKNKNGFALRVYFVKRHSKEIRQCGVQSVPFGYADPVAERIVGGTKAELTNLPWLIHIEANSTYCAGSLITKS